MWSGQIYNNPHGKLANYNLYIIFLFMFCTPLGRFLARRLPHFLSANLFSNVELLSVLFTLLLICSVEVTPCSSPPPPSSWKISTEAGQLPQEDFRVLTKGVLIIRRVSWIQVRRWGWLWVLEVYSWFSWNASDREMRLYWCRTVRVRSVNGVWQGWVWLQYVIFGDRLLEK